eukprot:gene20668-21347_t
MSSSAADTGPMQAADGTIRLTFSELQKISFLHLLSGLDENTIVSGSGDAVTTSISGYTEWISTAAPLISLGWDWIFDIDSLGLQLRRVGEPRSNVMVIDLYRLDLGDVKSEILLGAFVDTLNWQASVLEEIEMRYQSFTTSASSRVCADGVFAKSVLAK